MGSKCRRIAALVDLKEEDDLTEVKQEGHDPIPELQDTFTDSIDLGKKSSFSQLLHSKSFLWLLASFIVVKNS